MERLHAVYLAKLSPCNCLLLLLSSCSGQTVEGQCGRHCEGGPTDTIGIFEFNTRTNQVVGTHTNVGSGAASSTFASRDGEHIVMFGMDGGKTVQILQANGNGQMSTVAHEITLDFNITNVEDMPVFEDFAFIKHRGMDLFVLSSSNENKVAIVDLSGSSPQVDYVAFKNVPFDGRSRTRQVEWAYDTDYVWVSGPSEQNESHIIDVRNKKFVRSIPVNTGALLSVVNFEFLGLTTQLDQYANGGHSSSSSSFLGSSDSDNSSPISIAAIVLSTIAIVAVLVQMTMTAKNNNRANAAAAAAAATPAKTPAQMEEQSLAVPSVN